MSYTFALVGNPNSGKTTMFNEITGSTQHVGNWPGVTVEKKEGKAIRIKDDIRIIDLPGIYSLSPYSIEEIVARDYLINAKPDAIINIVDAVNLERNLFLTTQLTELGIPMVTAMNMMDSVETRGDRIDIGMLQEALGIPIVATSANKGIGIRELLLKAVETADKVARKSHPIPRNYNEEVESDLQKLEELIEIQPEGNEHLTRWVSLKLLEGDSESVEKFLPDRKISSIRAEAAKMRSELESSYGKKVDTILTEGRYSYISLVLDSSFKRANVEQTFTDKLDKIATNKFFALPLFLLIVLGVFQLTFGIIGTAAADFLDKIINVDFHGFAKVLLQAAGADDWLVSLVVDGIISGVGSVVIFIPQIMTLFFFISLLEDTGYMARAAFVMDRFMRKIGLSGKSFIPMIMGFGCSVPAILAARTLKNENDRRMTIILTPFMSCSARLPIYALFAAAFFSANQSLIILSVYILGIAVAILAGLILRKWVLKGEAAPFIMELPPYRLPTGKGLLIHMWERGKGFVKKAGTVIFAASVVLWFAQSFSISFVMVKDPSESILGLIGKLIAPLFAPLGFGDWKSSVAILTGVIAKELVVATTGILHGTGDSAEALTAVLRNVYTPLRAYAFMVFTMLYLPCIAAFAAIKSEMNSWKWTFFAVGFQTGVAWIAALIVYQGGRLFGL